MGAAAWVWAELRHDRVAGWRIFHHGRLYDDRARVHRDGGHGGEVASASA